MKEPQQRVIPVFIVLDIVTIRRMNGNQRRKNDVDRNTSNRLALARDMCIIALVYTCALDWDHIWLWLLETVPPLVLHTPGRPFHAVVVFLVYAMVVSAGITALVVRRSDLEE